MINIEEIKKYLKVNLSEYRYEHSIRVAREARKLAKYYNFNEENAYIAGLLHDIAKEYSIEENRNIITKYKLSKELINDSNKNICHAVIGSIVAKELFGVDDDVCQAIKYHTVGNKNMSFFDKIIFIADKIESGKNYPNIDDERMLAYIDLDKCLLLCLTNTKKKLEGSNRNLNKDSKELLDYLNPKISL